MPATTRTPLGASTGNRKWYFDVNIGTYVSPVWTPIMGVTDQTFNPDSPHLEDDSDMDSGGFESQTKTGAAWSGELTVGRKTLATDTTSYDPGQEFIRVKSIGKFGPSNSVDVRIYEMEPNGPRVEAYRGRAAASWEPQGGNMEALDMAKITLTGQGQLTPIAHPDVTTALPTVSLVNPNQGPAAGGQLVYLRGSGFSGASAITIGGTAVTQYSVEADNQIALVTPAKAASTNNVVRVTTTAGQSSASGPTYTYV